MPTHIRIVLESGEVEAIIDDSPTGEAVRAALPLEGTVSRWGEEIYFSIPVQIAEAPDARQQMAVGELAFWPVGSAFCIFWGRTPASSGPLPQAYSNVNPFGTIEEMTDDDAVLLSKATNGQKIRIEPSVGIDD